MPDIPGNRSRRRVAGIVIAIALLAGCGSLSGGGVPSASPDETVTPAPVPTEAPTPTPIEQLAPGITENGVQDPLTLAEAHESELSNRSETVKLRREVRYANGDLRALRIQESRVSADRRQFHTVITSEGSFPPFRGDRLEFYSDGQTILQATVLPNQSSYYRLPLDRYREQNNIDVVLSSPDAGTVFLLFTVMDTRLADRIVGQRLIRYRLTSRRLVRPGMLAEAEDVTDPRNATLRAIVDERGILREYTLRYDATVDGRNVTVTKSGVHTAVGHTTVDRPEWVQTALNRTA